MSNRVDRFRRFLSVGLSGLVVSCLLSILVPADMARAQETTSQLPPELTEVREALEKYEDPFVAVHDGYFSTVGCVAYPEGGGEGEVPYDPGAMGVHFLNPRLLDGKVDPQRPEVLVYNRLDDGTLRLMAAEWMVPLEAASERPMLFGQEFDGPMVGHEPLMPEGFHHYDLHAWLWTENPAGRFAPTNPGMECPDSGYTVYEETPDLVESSEPEN